MHFACCKLHIILILFITYSILLTVSVVFTDHIQENPEMPIT